MIRRIGKRTLQFAERPFLLSHAAAVGKKEGDGPLGAQFDFVTEDDRMGQKSWELAESELQKTAIDLAVKKAGLQKSDLDVILAGDLLNQCIGTGFAVRGQDIPFYGLYGACSTMAESLSLAAMMLDGGFGEWAAAMTSSHFCSAERQYRTPLEYGSQRTPTAQWTVTGSGCVILARGAGRPLYNPCDHGQNCGQGHQGRQQHGCRHGPGRLRDHQGPFSGHRPQALRL